MVGELHRLLNQTLTEGTAADNRTAVIILDGTGEDLGCRSRTLINEHHQREMLIRATTISLVVLTGIATAFGIDDKLALGEELIGNLHSRLEIATRIATQVDDQTGESLLCQLRQGDEKLGIGVLAEILYLNIAAFIVEHITGGNALGGNLTTSDGNMADSLLAVADDTQLHLRVLRTLQTVHGLLVGNLLADKDRVVDLDNLVASQHTGTLCGAVADDILHADGVLTDGELDADAGERAAEVVVGNLALTGSDVDGVRVELAEDLRHGLLNEVVHIDGVDVLVVDDMQQIVQFVSAGIDDAQTVAGEMVGVESSDQDACHNTHRYPERRKTGRLFHISYYFVYSLRFTGDYISIRMTSMPARRRRSMPSVRRYCSP